MAVDLAVNSNTLAVGREREITLAGPIRVTFESFSGHDLMISPRSGGSIRTKFTVPWGKASISTAEADWQRHRRAGGAAAGGRQPAGDRRQVRGSRHVRVRRAAPLRDRESLDRAAGSLPGADDRHHQRDHRRRRLSVRSSQRVSGIRARRQDARPHQSRRGAAQHHERARARAGQRRRGGGRVRRHAGILDRRDHARDPRRDRRADDAERLVPLSGDRHHDHRRRRRPAAARRGPRLGQRRRRYRAPRPSRRSICAAAAP